MNLPEIFNRLKYQMALKYYSKINHLLKCNKRRAGWCRQALDLSDLRAAENLGNDAQERDLGYAAII